MKLAAVLETEIEFLTPPVGSWLDGRTRLALRHVT